MSWFADVSVWVEKPEVIQVFGDNGEEQDYVPERTCHDANTRFNAWTCSECKCTLQLMFDDYGESTLNIDGVASVPNYCPNCGARVEVES